MLMKRSSLQAARLPAQSQSQDRRQHVRHDGAGLKVELGGQSWPVVDISTGGLSLSGLDRAPGDRFRLVLGQVGAGDGIACECEVVGRDADVTRLLFTRPTLPLLRLIVGHVGKLTGIVPHLLHQG